jgi:outer membrane protein
MKNLSLVLNAVLLIAVAVLYFLHFSGGSSGKSSSGAVDIKDLKIAYINSDSVLKYYDFFKVNREKLETKGKRLDQDLKNRATAYQSDVEAYQRNANNLTPNQYRAIEEDLGKKRQNLQMYQESLSQELMADQEKLTKELYSHITSYLKKYGQENGLQVVMKYDASSDVLYGADALDISKIVIDGLNQAYKSEQSESPVKNDSTTKN